MKTSRNPAVRNLIASLVILCALFVADNRAYFFSYLPFQAEYRVTQAYLTPSWMKFGNVRVNVSLDGEIIGKATVKRSFAEHDWDEIPVGYSLTRPKAVVRIAPVVTWGQEGAFVALILGNIGFVLRLKKASKT